MKIKIIFGLFILVAFSVLISGSNYKSEIATFNIFDQTESGYFSLIENLMILEAQNNDLSYCSPRLPKNPTIIIRMDDIGAWNRYETSKLLTDTILKHNYKVSLGVIPYDIGKDKRIVSWLRKLREDDRVEITLHGYNHEPNEFMKLSKEDADLHIKKGKDILIKNIGVSPVTFIPPYNEYSSPTIEVLKENGFLIFSAKEDEFEISNNFISLGYNSRAYDFAEERFIPNDEIIENCKTSLNEKNICVILMHPQDYAISGEDIIDEQLFEEFTNLLNELGNLEAEFKTFNDQLVCPSS
jgi:peptidoglycan/xylan/chitin deacetylase (PgdA/CDA1 family)